MNNTKKLTGPRGWLSRLVRISFCGMPALIWGGLFAIFDPTIGGLCAIAGFWLGWQCTEAKPERGESDNPNIRDAKGSGKKPTKAMLKQEKKIKRKAK